VEEQWSGYFDHCDSNHWLHFQQLDWERNWLVFRDEQFSFSHDERAYHRDGHFHSQSQPYSNADDNPHSYSNADANPDGYAYPDANTLTPTPTRPQHRSPTQLITATYGDDDGFRGEARR